MRHCLSDDLVVPEIGITIGPEWHDLVSLLSNKTGPAKVYVVGGPDTGKTTLCLFIASQALPEKSLALIDCDPGQAWVGPPTTVGLQIHHAGPEGRQTEFHRFIGNTTPAPDPVGFARSVVRLTENAEQQAALTVLDSSGFLDGPSGVAFQRLMIEATKPDTVVIVEAADAPSDLPEAIADLAPEVTRIQKVPDLVPRSTAERRAYRRERYRGYFEEAEEQALALDGMSLAPGPLHHPEDLSRLCALCDLDGSVASLCVVRCIEPGGDAVRILAPPFDRQAVDSMTIGKLMLDRELREIRST